MSWVKDIFKTNPQKKEKRKIENDVFNKKMKIKEIEYIKEKLDELYSKLGDNGNVIKTLSVYVNGQEYEILVPVDYLKDIVDYSWGTCRSLIWQYNDKIKELEGQINGQ